MISTLFLSASHDTVALSHVFWVSATSALKKPFEGPLRGLWGALWCCRNLHLLFKEWMKWSAGRPPSRPADGIWPFAFMYNDEFMLREKKGGITRVSLTATTKCPWKRAETSWNIFLVFRNQNLLLDVHHCATCEAAGGTLEFSGITPPNPPPSSEVQWS